MLMRLPNPCTTAIRTSELYQNIGSLISSMKTDSISKLYFQLKSLSDCRTLDMLLSISPGLEISLLVQPDMEKLLTLMKSISFEILSTESVLEK